MTEAVFVGCPTHNGQMDSGTARALYAAASRERPVIGIVNGKSLLSSNCNTLWCAALNARQEHGIKWFAMLHADIDPEMWWLDTLIDEAEKVGADMLSAVVPIKDERGITSTAIGERSTNCAAFRLTQSQIHHEMFPQTFDTDMALNALSHLPGELAITDEFDDPLLLLNTGCMICRVDKDWSESVFFENRDWIEMHNGVWRANDFSEDWLFTKKVHQCGGRVFGTTAARVVHKGVGLFDSSKVWGLATDNAKQERILT